MVKRCLRISNELCDTTVQDWYGQDFMDIAIIPMVTDSTAAADQTRRLDGGEGGPGVGVEAGVRADGDGVAGAGAEAEGGAEAMAGHMTHRITIDVAPVNDLPILTLPAVITHNHSHPDFTTNLTKMVTSVTDEDTAVEIRGVKIFDVDHASDDQGTKKFTFVLLV